MTGATKVIYGPLFVDWRCQGYKCSPWDLVQVQFMHSQLKSYGNYFCSSSDSYNPISSQFCTCHLTCAMMWPDWIYSFSYRSNPFYMRVGLWADKPSYKIDPCIIPVILPIVNDSYITGFNRSMSSLWPPFSDHIFSTHFFESNTLLKLWAQDKMATILQTTVLHGIFFIEMCYILLEISMKFVSRGPIKKETVLV